MPALSVQRSIGPASLLGLGVAVSAVDRSASSRLEGHFSLLAALGTDYREHLSPGRAVARRTVAVALGFPERAARCSALGIVGVASLGKQLLFAGTEGES